MSAPGWQLGEMMEETVGALADAYRFGRWGIGYAHEAVSAVNDELVRPVLDMSYEARMLRWQARLSEPEAEAEEA